jgi:hypothetical protein
LCWTSHTPLHIQLTVHSCVEDEVQFEILGEGLIESQFESFKIKIGSQTVIMTVLATIAEGIVKIFGVKTKSLTNMSQNT